MYTKILSRKFELWPNNTPREKKTLQNKFSCHSTVALPNSKPLDTILERILKSI